MSDVLQLSKRERQIMEIIYAAGEATANQVVAALPDPPSNTAVRTMLGVLERKGHVLRRRAGREHVYRPVRRKLSVGRSVFRRVLATFFGGSLEQAIAAHLADPKGVIPSEEAERIKALIEDAQKTEKRQ